MAFPSNSFQGESYARATRPMDEATDEIGNHTCAFCANFRRSHLQVFEGQKLRDGQPSTGITRRGRKIQIHTIHQDEQFRISSGAGTRSPPPALCRGNIDRRAK